MQLHHSCCACSPDPAAARTVARRQSVRRPGPSA